MTMLLRARSRPSERPLRPKSQEPESVESRAARRSEIARIAYEKNERELEELRERIKKRKPLVAGVEDLSAGISWEEMTQQKAVQKKKVMVMEQEKQCQLLREVELRGRNNSPLKGSAKVKAQGSKSMTDILAGKKAEEETIKHEQWAKIQDLKAKGACRQRFMLHSAVKAVMAARACQEAGAAAADGAATGQ